LTVGRADTPWKVLADSVGSDIVSERQSYPLNFRQLEEKDARLNAPFANGYSTRYSEILTLLGKNMNRTDLHAAFAQHFSSPPMKASTRITEADLRAVEATLKTTFPRSYISFATTHGPLFTPDILHKLVDAREAGRPAPEGFDVQEFFSPSEILDTHRMYVSGGMDDSVVPFAMDSGGNVFGFPREERMDRPDDIPVLIFDHDYCKVCEEADSFDTWLEGFLLLEA
jgi:hypothetical protein